MSHLSTPAERELVKQHPMALARGDHVEIYQKTGLRTTRAHLLSFAQRVVSRERTQPFLHNAGVETFKGSLHTGGGAHVPQSHPIRQPNQSAAAAAAPTQPPPPPAPANAASTARVPSQSFHALRMARKRADARLAAQAPTGAMDLDEVQEPAAVAATNPQPPAAHPTDQLGAPHLTIEILGGWDPHDQLADMEDEV